MKDFLIEIPNDNPFENDEFEREIIARNFMRIFNKDEDGIILSIDSNWGTGKTTFIKMWESLINNDEDFSNSYETLYFNAWDSDYMEDPLLAILAELEINKDKGIKEGIKNITESGKKLIATVSNFVVKAGSAGALEVADLNPKRHELEKIYPDLTKTIGVDSLENAIMSKQLRENFKENINKSIKGSNKKIIFFIDELDRCRPRFAIELLETIKHLFSMNGVIFVISLDKEQLSHSVATIYGEKMDSNGYLRRFFDLDYKLPNPNKIKYLDIKCMNIFDKYENIDYFNQFLKSFVIDYGFSLRDIDKLCYYLNFILPTIKEFKVNRDSYMHSAVISYIYAYLISLKIKKPNLYKKIMDVDYEKDTDTIKNIFGLQHIAQMDLNIKNNGKMTNKEMLDVIRKKVIQNYLELNYIAHTNPTEIYNTQSNEYVIELEQYTDSYDMKNIFDYDGNNKIKSNLEFMNYLNYNI